MRFSTCHRPAILHCTFYCPSSLSSLISKGSLVEMAERQWMQKGNCIFVWKLTPSKKLSEYKQEHGVQAECKRAMIGLSPDSFSSPSLTFLSYPPIPVCVLFFVFFLFFFARQSAQSRCDRLDSDIASLRSELRSCKESHRKERQDLVKHSKQVRLCQTYPFSHTLCPCSLSLSLSLSLLSLSLTVSLSISLFLSLFSSLFLFLSPSLPLSL